MITGRDNPNTINTYMADVLDRGDAIFADYAPPMESSDFEYENEADTSPQVKIDGELVDTVYTRMRIQGLASSLNIQEFDHRLNVN